MKFNVFIFVYKENKERITAGESKHNLSQITERTKSCTKHFCESKYEIYYWLFGS